MPRRADSHVQGMDVLLVEDNLGDIRLAGEYLRIAEAICNPNLSRNHQASIPKEVFLVSRTNDVVVVVRLRERPGDGKRIVEKRVAECRYRHPSCKHED